MSYELRSVTTLLQVYDMPASIRFYRDLLGFTVINTSQPLDGADRFHWVWLRRDAADLMLNTAYETDEERPSAPDSARVAAHDDTCLYFISSDVDAAFEELRHKLPSLQPPKITFYGMKQLYLHDPDGYGLCLQSPAKA
jgi:catechol 2,3-dioxygenase-like lactoylglutathione lyase family enzyme